MKHKYYFPSGVANRRAWLLNYKTQIGTVGGDLGMSAADITAEKDACQAMIDKIDQAETAKAAAKSKTTERDNSIKTGMKDLSTKIRNHKSNSGYTEVIGESLEIIGSELVIDYTTVKTTVKVGKTPAGVSIKFTLENCERGNIYCKRGSETEFTLIKSVMHPQAEDARPNLGGVAVEQRQYYVMLMIGDEEVGVPSAIETINN